MSQLTADAMRNPHDPHALSATPAASFPQMRTDNITVPPGTGKSASMILLVIGLIGLGVTAAVGFTGSPAVAKHALAAYHVGVMATLGISLGGLFLTLTAHLFGAGWSISLRRQFENLAAMVPVCLVLLIPTLALEIMNKGILFTWMGDKFAGDHLLEAKSSFLNVGFFLARAVIYSVIWVMLVRILRGYSLQQDRTGDKWISNRARKTSCWGILLFGLSVAFAAFDWLMSTDFRFFSTMWGVYFFAGSAFASTAVIILIVSRLKRLGKLEGLVTIEHYHDLGKLMLAFTVFWAYISFSQYFLIWYSNIPEETAWFLARKHGGWEKLFFFLCFGHFIVPFLIFLFRGVKRSFKLLPLMAMWAVLVHIADIFFIVRPMVYPGSADAVGVPHLWLDAVAIIGVVAVWAALLIKRVTSGVLVPLHDPKMAEAIGHRNYV